MASIMSRSEAQKSYIPCGGWCEARGGTGWCMSESEGKGLGYWHGWRKFELMRWSRSCTVSSMCALVRRVVQTAELAQEFDTYDQLVPCQICPPQDEAQRIGLDLFKRRWQRQGQNIV